MADTPDPFSGLAPTPTDLAETPALSGSTPSPAKPRARPALWFVLGVGATFAAGGAYLLMRDHDKGPREMAVITQMAAATARDVDLLRPLSALGPVPPDPRRLASLIVYDRAAAHLLDTGDRLEGRRTAFLGDLLPAYCGVVAAHEGFRQPHLRSLRCDGLPSGEDWWRAFEGAPVALDPTGASEAAGLAAAAHRFDPVVPTAPPTPTGYIPRVLSTNENMPPAEDGYRWCKIDPGHIQEIAATQTCAQAGFVDAYQPAPVALRAAPLPPSRCRDSFGQIIELSAGQACASAGYTDADPPPAIIPGTRDGYRRCLDSGRQPVDVAISETCRGAGYLDPPEARARPRRRRR